MVLGSSNIYLVGSSSQILKGPPGEERGTDIHREDCGNMGAASSRALNDAAVNVAG